MQDQYLKKIFATQKVDVPDEGFSEHITKQLPERKSLLPQIIMIAFIMIGLALVFVIQGFAPVFDQIYSLVAAINRSQMPSLTSVITYLSLFVSTGIISYSVKQVVEY